MRQPGVTERWQKQRMASPFGTIHAATFSFSRPIGTTLPLPPALQLASVSTRDVDVTGSVARDEATVTRQKIVFPIVNRELKRRSPAASRAAGRPADLRSCARTPIETPAEAPVAVAGPQNEVVAQSQLASPLDPELEAALKSEPLPHYEASHRIPRCRNCRTWRPAATSELPQPDIDGFNVRTARLFFGYSSLGGATAPSSSLERWAPGEAPVVVVPGHDSAGLPRY